ncbi:Uncharacterised protein [Escherichia coli]|nr:Uncharacterised protein [Escherichia coli]
MPGKNRISILSFSGYLPITRYFILRRYCVAHIAFEHALQSLHVDRITLMIRCVVYCF